MSEGVAVGDYPFLQVIGGIVYLIVELGWIWWFIRRGDPWLRERIGRLFGVTLIIAGRGMWKVREPGQGMRGFLIEMLQPFVWIPVVMLPLIGFVVVLMVAGGG